MKDTSGNRRGATPQAAWHRAQLKLRQTDMVLLPKLGRHRLQLFHEGVGRAVARYREGTIVDYLHRAFERRIQCPRGDGTGRVGCGIVKTDFQQDAFLDSREEFGLHRVA
jgi:hypothetical protein